MAVKKDDPRHPDTDADSAPAGSTPAAAEADPADYGFRAIEESEAAAGPGAIEPTRVDPVSSVPNSTFASRAGKAVQAAENK